MPQTSHTDYQAYATKVNDAMQRARTFAAEALAEQATQTAGASRPFRSASPNDLTPDGLSERFGLTRCQAREVLNSVTDELEAKPRGRSRKALRPQRKCLRSPFTDHSASDGRSDGTTVPVCIRLQRELRDGLQILGAERGVHWQQELRIAIVSHLSANTETLVASGLLPEPPID